MAQMKRGVIDNVQQRPADRHLFIPGDARITQFSFSQAGKNLRRLLSNMFQAANQRGPVVNLLNKLGLPISRRGSAQHSRGMKPTWPKASGVPGP